MTNCPKRGIADLAGHVLESEFSVAEIVDFVEKELTNLVFDITRIANEHLSLVRLETGDENSGPKRQLENC